MSKPIYDNTADGPFGPIVNGTQIVFFEYRPNKSAGYAFLALFALATCAHLFFLVKRRAWFFIPFILGGISETFGYYGRTQASDRPSEAGPFILQNLLILVGAPFLAATIYMSLGRVTYSLNAQHHAFLSLRWMTKLYVLIDFGCIGTQFVGSIIPASGDPTAVKQARVILLAGIIVQFSALTIFMLQLVVIELRIARDPPSVLRLAPDIKWRRYFRAIGATAVLSIVRAIVRAVEYLQGNKGEIMTNEWYLYVFDAALMFLVMVVFLAVHPMALVRNAYETREIFGEAPPQILIGSVHEVMSTDGMSPAGQVRTRRGHRKSRAGCLHCKKRKVKCDETRPRCFNCQRFGIRCSFTPDSEVQTEPCIKPGPSNGDDDSTNKSSTLPFLPARGRGRPRRNWAATQVSSPVPTPPTNESRLAECSRDIALLLSPGKETTSSADVQPALNLAHAELLHHWFFVTGPSLTNNPQGNTSQFWARNAPRIGLDYPFVLHLALSLSAYHILHLKRAGDRDSYNHYLSLAQYHNSLGLAELSQALPRIDDASCGALYIATMLVGLGTLAAGPGGTEDLLVCDMSRTQPGRWLPLARGVRLVHELSNPAALTSGLMALFGTPDETEKALEAQKKLPYQRNGLPRLDWEKPLESFRLHLSSQATEAGRSECLQSLDTLVALYKGTFGDNNGQSADGPGDDQAMKWLYTMGDSYVTLVRNRDMMALLVLAHFAPLLCSLGRCWFVKGWASHILKTVENQLSGQGIEWLQWPREATELLRNAKYAAGDNDMMHHIEPHAQSSGAAERCIRRNPIHNMSKGSKAVKVDQREQASVQSIRELEEEGGEFIHNPNSVLIMAAKIDFRNPDRPIRVGVVLLGGYTEFMDIAPIDFLYQISTHFLKAWNWDDAFMPPELKNQAVDFQFHWVTESGTANSGKLTSCAVINPTDSFESCPPLDIVLYGAHGIDYQPNEAELAFARKVWDDCSAFITICGGIEVPLQAGILKGRRATAPRGFLGRYRELAPGTEWVEKRWERDGKLWTSGALINGQELMRAFTHEYWGEREDALVRVMAKMGSWTDRDVDYKDEVLS
ncbi:Protein RTA1 [Paramyrothecium foliicola]|nr:Protein RTA1 [Paramyrothecium foliicola]